MIGRLLGSISSSTFSNQKTPDHPRPSGQRCPGLKLVCNSDLPNLVGLDHFQIPCAWAYDLISVIYRIRPGSSAAQPQYILIRGWAFAFPRPGPVGRCRILPLA